MERLSYLAILLLLGLVTHTAKATEISVFAGTLNHSAVGGCCLSSGNKTGAGALGTFDLKPFGDINLHAYTDGRWSEGVIGKPYYLIGQRSRTDTGSGDMVQAFTVSNWRWVTSIGIGYFSHTTTQKRYSLPILVTGFVVSNMNQILYSIDDNWSAGAVLQFSAGISASDTSVLVGTYLTVAYTFK